MHTFHKTGRGFDVVGFDDANGNPCTLQQSSAVRDYPHSWDHPGSSCVWLGIDDAKPQIMASDADRLGMETQERNGWVPYPIPEGVLLTTRMHLDREQVKDLVTQLNHWLETGTLNPEITEKLPDE